METFSALLAICAGNSPVPGDFPAQRPVTRSFDVFFNLCLNKRLSKQSWGWWFEMISCPLWRHCNDSWQLCLNVKIYGTRCPWMMLNLDYWDSFEDMNVITLSCPNLNEGLPHLPLNKMAAILQTTYSSAFSWMKILEVQLKFHWNLFLMVKLIISQCWFR